MGRRTLLLLTMCGFGSAQECAECADASSSLLQARSAGAIDREAVHSGVAHEDQMADLVSKVIDGREKITDSTKQALAAIDTQMDTILANCNASHRAAQGIVDGARDDVIACGSAVTTAFTEAGGVNALSSAVGLDRSTHSGCRALEKTLIEDKTVKCDASSTYRDGLQMPSCITCGGSVISGYKAYDMSCVNSLATWTATVNSTLTSKKKSCDDADTGHSDKVSLCNTDQTTFESAFCSYRVALTTACGNQVKCRSTKSSSRNTTVSSANVTERAFNAEWASAMKVKCYLNVLSAAEADMPGLFEECKKLTVSTSHLRIKYHPLPDAEACDLTPVATHPCGAAWLASEYEGEAWHGKAPTQTCTPCAAISPPSGSSSSANTSPNGKTIDHIVSTGADLEAAVAAGCAEGKEDLVIEVTSDLKMTVGMEMGHESGVPVCSLTLFSRSGHTISPEVPNNKNQWFLRTYGGGHFYDLTFDHFNKNFHTQQLGLIFAFKKFYPHISDPDITFEVSFTRCIFQYTQGGNSALWFDNGPYSVTMLDCNANNNNVHVHSYFYHNYIKDLSVTCTNPGRLAILGENDEYETHQFLSARRSETRIQRSKRIWMCDLDKIPSPP